MEKRISQDWAGSRDVENGFEQQYHTTTTTPTTNGSKQRQRSSSSLSSLKAKLFTARSILGVLSMILAVAILGVVGYMVGKYGDQGFAHVSFVFVGIMVRIFLGFFFFFQKLSLSFLVFCLLFCITSSSRVLAFHDHGGGDGATVWPCWLINNHQFVSLPP